MANYQGSKKILRIIRLKIVEVPNLSKANIYKSNGGFEV